MSSQTLNLHKGLDIDSRPNGLFFNSIFWYKFFPNKYQSWIYNKEKQKIPNLLNFLWFQSPKKKGQNLWK